MSRSYKYWLLGVAGFSAVFRFHALFANTFQPDEALFATWARYIAVWRDPLLLTQVIDKPPFLFYGQALFYPLLGPVEWAARMPNFIVSLLLVPLTGLLAWNLWREEETAVFTSLLIAFSPLAIQFSATAFTDPLMTFLVVASLQAGKWTSGQVGKSFAIDHLQLTINHPAPVHLFTRSPLHPFICGFLFGLALATKYQALLFLPLLAGFARMSGWKWQTVKGWLAGFVPVVGVVVAWDVARTGTFSLVAAQVSNYGGTRLIWSWELWPRLQAWWGAWWYVLGWGWLLTAVFLFYRRERKGRREETGKFLWIYLGGYFVVHWLLAVPVWERYALPAVPFVAMVMGRGFAQTNLLKETRAETQRRRVIGEQIFQSATIHSIRVYLRSILLVLLLLPAAWAARNGRFPIGSSPTSDKGSGQIAALLQDAPYGTVLYDHWFSWQWRYHLFDAGVYVSWFPYPAALAEDLAVFGRDGHIRYLVLPDSAVSLPVRRAVEEAGFMLVEETKRGEMVLYRLQAAR